MPFDWTCPHCNKPTTVTDNDYLLENIDLKILNSEGYRRLTGIFVVCPNSKCKKFGLRVVLHNLAKTKGPDGFTRWEPKEPLQDWDLVPESSARPFPDYIPKQILNDYKEACLIRNKSPKASATLSRRCLQGAVRDFWKVKAGRLVDEIAQIKGQVDPATWDAIEAVRKIGNIGAHMEEDVNLIIDVETDEADLLIQLIETLFQDWYITREERKQRLQSITDVAQRKSAAKKAGPSP